MAAKRVTVEMTLAEAKALWHAAGNTIDHPDAMEATFPNGSQRNAAYRGHDKLASAWVRAERGLR